MKEYVKELKALAYMVHDAVMRETGGTVGVRYDADLERVSDVLETARTIALKHPFVDGNKRTAFCLYVLDRGGPTMDTLLMMLRVDDEDGKLAQLIEDIITDHFEWLLILSGI